MHIFTGKVYVVFLLIVFISLGSGFSVLTHKSWANKNSFKQSVDQESTEQILDRLAMKTIQQHIQPRYKTLLQSSGALNIEMQRFCQSPSAKGLSFLKNKFSQTVLAFAAIEHIRFGPIIDQYRLERLVYWPDHKGRGRRAVRKLINAQDPMALNAAKFANKSVAVQGLTALEYVLFGKGAEDLLKTEDAGSYRCAYGMRITANVSEITKAVMQGWLDGGLLVKEMLNPAPTNKYYRKRSEVILELYQSVTIGLKNLHDGRILPLFGRKGTSSKPKLAAFWRSGLAIAIMRTNVMAIDHFVEMSGFERLLAKTPVDLQFHVGKIFKSLYLTLDDFLANKLSMADVLSEPLKREQLKELAKLINHLNVGFSRYFAVAADLPLGFNASDGD